MEGGGVENEGWTTMSGEWKKSEEWKVKNGKWKVELVFIIKWFSNKEKGFKD